MSRQASELLRRAMEERARAEAALDYEHERRRRLEASGPRAVREAGLGRRLLGRLVGSRVWAMCARASTRRSPTKTGGERFSSADYAGEYARREQALRTRERLRRENDRVERRLRALERGTAEIRRAMRSAFSKGGVSPARRGRLGAIPVPLPFGAALPHVAVVVGGPVLRCGPSVLRTLRERPGRLVVARAGEGGFGPAVARAVADQRSDIVVVCAVARARPPRGWLERLTRELEGAPGLGAVASRVEASASLADGAWRFDWIDAVAQPRVFDLRGQMQPPAVGGTCIALRRSALERIEQPCSDYRGTMWAVDLSLSLRAQGIRVGLSEEAFAGSTPPPLTADLSLLRQRWGSALRRAVLTDLLAGGGEWCARGLRVVLDPRLGSGASHAVDTLGWDRTAAERGADAVVAATGTDSGERITVDWTPGRPGAPALTRLSAGDLDATAAAELRDLLTETVAASSFSIRVGAPDWESARAGGDLQLARALGVALARAGHHAAIQVAGDDESGPGSSLDVLINMRGRAPAATGSGQLNVIWLMSHPRDVTDAELEGYDLVLVASSQHAEMLSHRLRVPVAELLQFTDPESFFPEPDPASAHEILFAGNWRSTLRPIVWDAVETGFAPALYGRGWERFFPERLVKRHVSRDDLRRLYSSCAVLLADHWEDMRETGFVSNRVFDALACGAFVIADRCAGLAELLEGAVVTYADSDDLRSKLERFLADPEARRERAALGRTLVLERHTASRRAAELLEALSQARRFPDRAL